MSETETEAPAGGRIVTSCRDCVFADYAGNTQTGCLLGRIDRFEGQGASVVGLDDGQLRYLTVDRFCNLCHAADSPYLEGVPSPGWEAKLRRHVQPRCAYIIHASSCPGTDALGFSLDWVACGDIRPAEIVVVLDEDSPITPPAAIREIKKRGQGVSWQVVRMEPADAHQANAFPDPASRAIDHAVSKLDPDRITYYVRAEVGQQPPASLLASLDAAINEAMIPVAAVTLRGRLVAALTLLHLHPEVVGNRGVRLEAKLPWLAEAHGLRVLDCEEWPDAA